MGKFWSYFTLALVAGIFTTTTGNSIRRPKRNPAMLSDSRPWKYSHFRPTRSVEGVNIHPEESEEANSESDMTDDSCYDYFECLQINKKDAIIKPLIWFKFANISQDLARQCPTRKESENCDVGNCNRSVKAKYSYRFSTLLDKMLAWACERREAFADGERCWADTFSRNMHNCERDIPSASIYKSSKDDRSIFCLTRVPIRMSTCTDKDAKLVETFITYSLHVAREIYPEDSGYVD